MSAASNNNASSGSSGGSKGSTEHMPTDACMCFKAAYACESWY
jgi:hypothetical protein